MHTMLTMSKGLDQVLVLGLTEPKMMNFSENLLLNSPAPHLSRSTYVGKFRKLSPPNRMDTLPECEVTLGPVYALHLGGVGNEYADPLSKFASITTSFNTILYRFSLTSVELNNSPCPVKSSRLILEEFPRE